MACAIYDSFRDWSRLCFALLVFVTLTSSARAAELRLLRGAAEYRACYYCHSLSPNVQLTGPSLANLWGKPAAKVKGYSLYSPQLKKSDLNWNHANLRAWLADPHALVSGTTMTFKGIKDADSLDPLMEFLKIAMASGGYDAVLKKKLIEKETADGQRPKNLSSVSIDKRVSEILHCRNVYSLKMADGAKQDLWELNLHFAVDSSETGPPVDQPALIDFGSMGDRFTIVFHDPSEIAKFVKECAKP